MTRDLHSTNFTEVNSHYTECHQKRDCRWLDFHGTHTDLTNLLWTSEKRYILTFGGQYKSCRPSLRSLLHYPFTLFPLSQISSSAPCSRTPSAYIPPSTWEAKFHTHTKQQATLWFCIFQSLCFWIQTGRQKTRDRKVASIPPVPSVVDLFMNGILIC